SFQLRAISPGNPPDPTGTTDFEFQGYLGGQLLIDGSGRLPAGPFIGLSAVPDPNKSGFFIITNSDAATTIDTLSISIEDTHPWAVLDNIVVNPVTVPGVPGPIV